MDDEGGSQMASDYTPQESGTFTFDLWTADAPRRDPLDLHHSVAKLARLCAC
jgi:hypothetical protein